MVPKRDAVEAPAAAVRIAGLTRRSVAPDGVARRADRSASSSIGHEVGRAAAPASRRHSNAGVQRVERGALLRGCGSPSTVVAERDEDVGEALDVAAPAVVHRAPPRPCAVRPWTRSTVPARAAPGDMGRPTYPRPRARLLRPPRPRCLFCRIVAGEVAGAPRGRRARRRRLPRPPAALPRPHARRPARPRRDAPRPPARRRRPVLRRGRSASPPRSPRRWTRSAPSSP